MVENMTKLDIAVRRRPRRGPDLVVRLLSASATRGRLAIGPWSAPCAIGRGGLKPVKREGDGATPIGCWVVRAVWYRADRGRRPATGLNVRPIRPRDGWCDATHDRNYNRPVTHPYPASAERMWREDDLYDVVVVLGYNDVPRRRGRGSAIFMHHARNDYRPTEGCVAMAPRDLRFVLGRLSRRSRIQIG